LNLIVYFEVDLFFFQLKSKTSAFVHFDNLLDGVDIGRRANVQAQVVFLSSGHDGSSRSFHAVLKPRVHNVLLGSTRHSLQKLLTRLNAQTLAHALLERALHRTEQMVVGVLLVFEGQAAVAHVIQILEPLEVGYCHAARIYVQIGYDQDVLFLEDLVGLGRCRTVSSLGYNLGKNRMN
jgi:hypothetical protein